MKSPAELVDEIVNDSVEGNVKVNTLLRKCRIISNEFSNETLADWVLKELNGYDDWKNLPSYRIIAAGAKGLLLGAFQAQINAQPLPSAILEKKHRHFGESVFLREPASAYENLKDEGNAGYRVEWPANLVVKYQSSFLEGYALNRAWQDLPVHSLRTVPETVINRVLEFGLSMKNAFGDRIEGSAVDINKHIDSAVMSILSSDKGEVDQAT
jgi:hypothetical protein